MINQYFFMEPLNKANSTEITLLPYSNGENKPGM